MKDIFMHPESYIEHLDNGRILMQGIVAVICGESDIEVDLYKLRKAVDDIKNGRLIVQVLYDQKINDNVKVRAWR